MRDIQSSDFVGRLRRAFGLRGSGMTPGIDEVITPVAMAYNLDQGPYRLDGFGVWVGAEAGPTAAQITAVEFTNQTAAGGRQYVVLEQVGIYNSGALAVDVLIGLRFAVLAASRIARTGEQAQIITPAGISDAFSLIPVEAAAQTRAATGLAASITKCNVPPGSTLMIPVDYVLPGTGTLVLETTAVNVPLGGFIVGRYFQNVG